MREVKFLERAPQGAVYLGNRACKVENIRKVVEVEAKLLGVNKIGVIVSKREDGRAILNLYDLEGKFRSYSDPHMAFDIWN